MIYPVQILKAIKVKINKLFSYEFHKQPLLSENYEVFKNKFCFTQCYKSKILKRSQKRFWREVNKHHFGHLFSINDDKQKKIGRPIETLEDRVIEQVRIDGLCLFPILFKIKNSTVRSRLTLGIL